VVSGLPELREYQPLISYAESVDEFIEQALEKMNAPRVGEDERRAAAHEHSWEKRAEQLLKLLNDIL